MIATSYADPPLFPYCLFAGESKCFVTHVFFVTGATSLGRVLRDSLEIYRVSEVRTASFRSPELLKELVARIGTDILQSSAPAAFSHTSPTVWLL